MTTNMIVHGVSMEHFAISSGRLATTGVNGGVGFVAVLDDGSDIFIEHRSCLLLPSGRDINEVREYFQKVAKNLLIFKPMAKITAVFIVSGQNKTNYQNIQRQIIALINTTFDNNEQSLYYREIIKYCDVNFNAPPDEGSEKVVGDPNLKIAVDQDTDQHKNKIFITQNIFKFGVSEILIGVLTINWVTNERVFTVIANAQQQGQTAVEQQYIQNVMTRFSQCAITCGATEVKNELALELLNETDAIISKVSFDKNIKEMPLYDSDESD